MKATIETTFEVRGKKVSSTYSYPVFSNDIEETLVRSLDFLEKHGSPYTLNFSLSKD